MQLTETGQTVYDRTYSRTKPDGTKETWPETVRRVVDGNLNLVDHKHELPGEREQLIELMEQFKIIPAGRHLWASGVKNAPYLFNCWVAPWGAEPWEHFSFTFLRLMEGGGVGSNYSNRYLTDYPVVQGFGTGGFEVHIVCDPEHPDYQKMLDAGVLSTQYEHEWCGGAFEVEDSREGWADALVDLLQVYYRDALNKCRVFDVSRVRPEGARLKTFGGRASGPLPLARMLAEVGEVMNARVGQKLDGIGAMEIDHSIATCVVSGGNRRSARMAIMHWDDDQIHEFISIKRRSGKHWTTNISVEVDDEFWRRIQDGSDLFAELLLADIAEGMLTNGEPGFWNSSLSNQGEPNPVICTNPCGEIPLEPSEPCNLGHINLAAFVDRNGVVDHHGLIQAHGLVTRFLIRATFAAVSDPESRQVLDRNRRIGVGHLGVASYLAMTNNRYSGVPRGGEFAELLVDLAVYVDRAAQHYAHQLRIPVPVKTRTVAPTGTIAKMPGVSEGIHPIFSRYFVRRIRFSNVDPDQRAQVEQYRARGYRTEPCLYAPETTVVEIPTMDSLVSEVTTRYGEFWADFLVESADEVNLEEMLAFQAMYQTLWADNAVSYTINVDPEKYTVDELVTALAEYGPRLKGCTIFPEMSMPQSPYERITKEQFEQYAISQISDGVDEECATGACPVR